MLTLWAVSTVTYEKRGLSVSECPAGPSPSFPCPGRELTADSTRWRRQDGGQLLTALSLCLLRRFRNSRNKHNKTIGSGSIHLRYLSAFVNSFRFRPYINLAAISSRNSCSFCLAFLPASGGLRRAWTAALTLMSINLPTWYKQWR